MSYLHCVIYIVLPLTAGLHLWLLLASCYSVEQLVSPLLYFCAAVKIRAVNCPCSNMTDLWIKTGRRVPTVQKMLRQFVFFLVIVLMPVIMILFVHRIIMNDMNVLTEFSDPGSSKAG